MPVYAIAQLSITEQAAYERYQDRFMDVLTRYHGRLLAADESPQIVEGSWNHEKVVVLAFADEPAFRAFETSAEYEEIARDRRAGANAVVLLVKGVPERGGKS